MWLDSAKTVVEMFGGRTAGEDDPAIAVSGGPFGVGNIVLCRSARGAAGLMWEIMPIAGASPADSCAQDDCLSLTVVSAAGRCAGIDTTQELTLTWAPRRRGWSSGDDAPTVPEDDFVHDLGLGPAVVWFADGEPKATIAGVHGTYAGCDGDCLLFRFAGAALCDGDGDGCEDNTFLVKVCCVCCEDLETGYTTEGWYCFCAGGGNSCEHLTAPPCNRVTCSGPHATQEECEEECCEVAGWGGEGWYCVSQFGGTCLPVELLDEDKCDEGYTICSGPYATEEEAEAACTCADCANLQSATVTIAGFADGPCGEACGGAVNAVGFDNWNGVWGVPLSGAGGGGGTIVGGVATGLVLPGSAGYVGCIPFFLSGGISVQVHCTPGGDTVLSVGLYWNSLPLVTYFGVVTCCGNFVLNGGPQAPLPAVCGTVPATIAVTLTCNPPIPPVLPPPPGMNMDDLSREAISQLEAEANAGNPSDGTMKTANPNLGDGA